MSSAKARGYPINLMLVGQDASVHGERATRSERGLPGSVSERVRESEGRRPSE